MRHTTAGEIEAAVRKLWLKNGNVVLSQVRNGTGYEKSARTADMMVFSVWPSRGIYCDGVEIKVSRSDLRSELAAPQKADDMAKYCRCWWLAVPDDLLTPEIMVPDVWGIVTVSDKGIASIARPAKPMEPVPMDALLVCSVFRNFAESHTPNHEINTRIRAGVEERLKTLRADKDYRLEQFTKAFQDFEEATGVNLLTDRDAPIWDVKGAGEAVKTLMSMRKTPAEALRAAADGMRNAGAVLEAAMTALEVRQ
jgi:hypothetical protein